MTGTGFRVSKAAFVEPGTKMKISGSAAVVTGGGSGIGAAIGRRLASLGAKVALLDINQTNCETVAREIGGIGIACNVADASASDHPAGAAREIFRRGEKVD